MGLHERCTIVPASRSALLSAARPPAGTGAPGGLAHQPTRPACLRAVASGDSNVSADALDAYIAKLCGAPDTAGETIAADLLAGGEDSLLAWGATMEKCKDSGVDLFDAFVKAINPKGNQDVDRVMECVAAWCCAAAAARCIAALPALLHATARWRPGQGHAMGCRYLPLPVRYCAALVTIAIRRAPPAGTRVLGGPLETSWARHAA